jgi:hypothetical protein
MKEKLRIRIPSNYMMLPPHQYSVRASNVGTLTLMIFPGLLEKRKPVKLIFKTFYRDNNSGGHHTKSKFIPRSLKNKTALQKHFTMVFSDIFFVNTIVFPRFVFIFEVRNFSMYTLLFAIQTSY